jgi:hypothetical protein
MDRCPVVVCLLAVAACGSSDLGEPQLPCRTSAYQIQDGMRVFVGSTFFEYDELGHPTREITNSDGGPSEQIVREFDGDHPTLIERTSGNITSRYTAEVVDDRVMTSSWTSAVGHDLTDDYTATWTWGPDGVEKVVTTIFQHPVPEETTCSRTVDGYECMTCEDSCTYWFVVGAEYVGDGLVFEQASLAGEGAHQGIWTERGSDDDGDGAIDRRETRTLDAHGLPLTHGIYEGGAKFYSAEYVRDADGTARSLVKTTVSGAFEVEFDYECDSAISP